jgi:electron transfer flavoprotein beta subunit
MRAVVLLSAGRHAASGRPMPVAAELQAVALARRAGWEVVGLHAGAADPAVAEALAHGLEHITILNIGPGDDPAAALAAEIAAMAPDVVLAGRRGQGGADTGLLPYAVAQRCGMAMAADAVALDQVADGLAVVQALPRGARRRLVLRGPAVVSVHEAAPPALPFVYRARLLGKITEKPGVAAPAAVLAFEAHARRRRPKLIGPAGGTAEERLRAATEAKSAGGKVMVNPAPAEAAAAILEFLRQV